MSIGGGKSSGSQSDPTGAALAKLATQFATETSGLRTGLISQLSSAMNGKPTGSQVPIISQAVESSRQAGSQAMQSTNDELARTGLVGTPYGQGILEQGKITANQNASNAGTQATQALYNMIPNFVLGTGQSALSGLSGAVGSNVSGSGKSTKAGMSVK